MSRKFSEVALIDEAHCIGCARCLEVCPVDAIVGASGFLHTVLVTECIGCRLCVKACPVDCISMVPTPDALRPKTPGELKARAEKVKRRFQARRKRLEEEKARHRQLLEEKKRRLLEKLYGSAESV